MLEKNTQELLNLLLQADSEKDLDAILKKQPNPNISFGAYFSYLLAQKHLTSVDIFNKVTFQRTYYYQMINGIRHPKRNKILALCAAIHCTLDETQRLLTLGERGILYSKNPRDAVIIYGLSKNLDISEINDLLYDKEMPVLE